MIELDQYPEIATERPILPGDIPPSISIVSFQVDDIDAVPVDFRAKPANPEGFPYAGGRAGVIVGPNGEWLEPVLLTAAWSEPILLVSGHAVLAYEVNFLSEIFKFA